MAVDLMGVSPFVKPVWWNVETQNRGIRNNNPLNIRVGNDWKGEGSSYNEKEFEVFSSPVYGFRASVMLFRSYAKRKPALKTVKEVVFVWAPPQENNSLMYVKTVCDIAQVKETDVVLSLQKPKLALFLQAMSLMENGRPSKKSGKIFWYDDSLVLHGIELGLK